MEVSKYLDLYLSESREHVAKLRELLPGGGARDRAVHELFRHAHSLKGMAASMGFESTSRLAHVLESLMNHWREGMAPTHAERQAAMLAVDTIDAMLDRVQESSSEAGGESAVEQAVAALAQASPQPPPGQPQSIPQAGPMVPKPGPAPAGPSEGAARIAVAIDSSSPLPAARLLVVCERIRALCPECVMEPDLDTVRSNNLHAASFRIKDGPGLKDLARALRDLPEVATVSLEQETVQASAASSERRLINTLRVQAEDMDALLADTSEMLYSLNQFQAGLADGERSRHRFWLEAHRTQLNRLFDHVLSLRLVSFETLAERLGRACRELSAKLGKELRFETEGIDEQADRSLLEKLLDPLMHLVRNALDHGLESREERIRAGKPPEGLLRLCVLRDAEALLISVSDDGRGIDVERIRQAAVERGISTPADAALMTREQLLELLTVPAFSTRRDVTDVSGRGVGLDVVRAAVESVGGHLEMRSEQGKGSLFTLAIPSATTLTHVLVFGWEESVRYGIPTSQVRHIYPLSSTPLVWSGDRRFLQAGEELLPVLSWRPGPVGREGFGLRLKAEGRDRILLVSSVHQAERVVILPWGQPLEMVPEWMGGALLATGEIAYILDGRVLAKREGEEPDVPEH